jgi:hypothetical protein
LYFRKKKKSGNENNSVAIIAVKKTCDIFPQTGQQNPQAVSFKFAKPLFVEFCEKIRSIAQENQKGNISAEFFCISAKNDL